MQSLPVKQENNSIFIVILNWNNSSDTIRCIDSLLHSNYDKYHLVVCDNGSTDDSVEHIVNFLLGAGVVSTTITPEESKGKKDADCIHKVTVITIEKNLGYAAGNNIGIQFSIANEAGFVFILNNDTVVDPACLARLIDFANCHSDAALLAPMILEPQPGGDEFVAVPASDFAVRPDFLSLLCPGALKTFFKEQHAVVPTDLIYYAPGCAMFFRSRCLLEIGYFDEETFLYYEEFIMAEKLRRLGYHTYYADSAKVWHLKGASTQKMVSANKYCHALLSEKYFLTKYYGLSGLETTLLNFIRILAYLRRCILQEDYRRSFVKFIKSYMLVRPRLIDVG